MTSEERAQETFRSLATEAVNTIMDALDMLGDFAPLHKNEMYGCKSTKTGRPIQGKYTVKRTGGDV